MKQKSHSGLKKRLKIKKSGVLMVEKSAKRHLLSNKSKRQKTAFPGGMHVHATKLKAVRRLMPGKAQLQRVHGTSANEMKDLASPVLKAK